MTEQETARVPGSREGRRTVIPHLKDLVYLHSGFEVPARFTPDFVRLHDGHWNVAERDWEAIVVLVLDTDAVSPRADGWRAVKQAVEAAVDFLVDDEIWPWCPICKRGTSAGRMEQDHDR
ncbi:hypothetical protein LUPAC06_02029 [Micromonospora saelicesensis]|uniref:hypothetical protein n=1 Tax=Micromonospora saelicesensis TaxID=285676 RepID=UPI000DC01F5E|nr:hypothetical protein [Micromonospora saelicesensis]RAO59081.1 hypothetical protein LUPAC06_02029 [Micromonospora saelicesensis]